MQTNTLCAHDFGLGHISVNGYTKDAQREEEVQICINGYGKGAGLSFYLSPDEARRFAAAVAAAACAAELPQ